MTTGQVDGVEKMASDDDFRREGILFRIAKDIALKVLADEDLSGPLKRRTISEAVDQLLRLKKLEKIDRIKLISEIEDLFTETETRAEVKTETEIKMEAKEDFVNVEMQDNLEQASANDTQEKASADFPVRKSELYRLPRSLFSDSSLSHQTAVFSGKILRDGKYAFSVDLESYKANEKEPFLLSGGRANGVALAKELLSINMISPLDFDLCSSCDFDGVDVLRAPALADYSSAFVDAVKHLLDENYSHFSKSLEIFKKKSFIMKEDEDPYVFNVSTQFRVSGAYFRAPLPYETNVIGSAVNHIEDWHARRKKSFIERIQNIMRGLFGDQFDRFAAEIRVSA